MNLKINKFLSKKKIKKFIIISINLNYFFKIYFVLNILKVKSL